MAEVKCEIKCSMCGCLLTWYDASSNENYNPFVKCNQCLAYSGEW